MNDPQPNPGPAPCRVCGESASFFFTRLVRGKINVQYFKCPACGQLQTQTPTWLDETYRNATFQLDVGMADRSVWTAQTVAALALKLGINPRECCLDWGGGTGLFVRLCRDYGLNYFYHDPYSANVFARDFESKAAGPAPAWTLVTAFEVAEHFADPIKNFGDLFQFAPRLILFSTLLHQGEGADWWYLGEDGQHVAFYTRSSLEVIAQRFGYHLASNGCDLHLFSRGKVSDRLLGSCRKHRVRWADKYRDRHGSRLLSDFDEVRRRFNEQANRQV